MKPIIDHIEITVRDMSVAVPFYDNLLPLLGARCINSHFEHNPAPRSIDCIWSCKP